MKKTLLLCALLTCALSQSVLGQASLSVSSGINYSTCAFTEVTDIMPSSRLGYFFGIAPAYRINKRVQFLVDVQYSMKGYEIGPRDNQASLAFRFAYIDIIPEVDYRVLDFLSLGIGVNYGFKTQEQVKGGNGDWIDPPIFDLIKSRDWGMTGKIKVHHKNLFGFVRYNLGLKNITEVSYTDVNGEPLDVKQRNRNLQIGIGYTFAK